MGQVPKAYLCIWGHGDFHDFSEHRVHDGAYLIRGDMELICDAIVEGLKWLGNGMPLAIIT